MDLKRAKNIHIRIILIGLIVFLNCAGVSAVEDELSLENELNQAGSNTAPAPGSTNPIPVSEQPTSEAAIDASLEQALNDPTLSSEAEIEAPPSAAVRSEVEYEKEELQVQSLEQEYAMKGFALGLVAFNHNYNLDARIRMDGVLVDISDKSADFASTGISARYAILPFNKIGTDINVSLSSSLNHADANFSSISIIKGEVNLGYAIHIGDLIPLYILGGVGYEHVMGKDIENILIPGGGTMQIGAGLGLGKKFNLEVFYCNAIHNVSAVFLRNARQAALDGGATRVGFNNIDSRVSSNIILGKLSVNF